MTIAQNRRSTGTLVAAVGGLVVIGICIAPWVGLPVIDQRNIELIGIYVLVISGLNLSFGYAGEMALGQIAVFAAGAYVTGILVEHGVHDVVIALVLSCASSAVIGLVSGAPGLRLRHWTLALASFFLILLIPDVVQIFTSQTGGFQGLLGIDGPTLASVQLDYQAFYVYVILVAAGWLVIFRNLVTGRYGLALRAMRESDELASSLGASTSYLRLSAYLMGSLPAGLAGSLYAYYVGFLDPTVFSFDLTVAVIAGCIVGGSESVLGPIIGAALLVYGPLQTGAFQRYSLLVYGIFLIVIGLAFREGIAGLARLLYKRWRLRRLDSMPGIEREDEPLWGWPALELPGLTMIVGGVTKHFGGALALDDVSLDAQPGEVTGIMGPNGAGKTTLLNAISGHVRAETGSIKLGDRELSRSSPARVARFGVGRTFQTPLIPATMTVSEVLISGFLRSRPSSIREAVFRTSSVRRRARDERQEADWLLRLAGLPGKGPEEARRQPLGTRRVLEVLRSVAGSPSLILLDEPAAGLDGRDLEHLAKLLAALRSAGATVVLVEHNVPFVLANADRVHVMNLGRVIASGPPGEIRRHPEVVESYLGKGLAARLSDRAGDPIRARDSEEEQA